MSRKKTKDKWLIDSKDYSATAREYIAKPESFLLRGDSKPEHAVIHVLDMAKKYLLGETHGSGKWKKDIAHWRVDRMREGNKALPAEADDKAGLFTAKRNPLNQPLESSHAYLLRVLLDAHDNLNVMSWVFRTFDEKQADDWELWAKGALKELDEVVAAYWGDYAPFIATYKKKYLPSLFDPASKTYRAASPRLAAIYKFATDFRDYGPELGALIKALKETRKLSRRKRTPKAADHKRLAAAVDAHRAFVPVLAKALIGIVSGADPKEAAALEALTAPSDTFREVEINLVADPVRERWMADNITKAAAPLLVQTGNVHVQDLAGLVGADAVPVDKTVKLSDITKRP